MENQQVLDFTEQGRALKTAGISRVVSHTPIDYKEAFCRFVLTMPEGQLFTSDDVVAAVGLPPHPNTTGGLINGLVASEAIEMVGHVQSKRASRHAAWIKEWRRI